MARSNRSSDPLSAIQPPGSASTNEGQGLQSACCHLLIQEWNCSLQLWHHYITWLMKSQVIQKHLMTSLWILQPIRETAESSSHQKRSLFFNWSHCQNFIASSRPLVLWEPSVCFLIVKAAAGFVPRTYCKLYSESSIMCHLYALYLAEGGQSQSGVHNMASDTVE